MGFFDGFTGRAQQRDLSRSHDASSNALAAGYQEASGISRGYHDRAMGQIQPWEQSGRGANALYDDALGTHGREAQSRFMANYQQDPFRAGNEDRAVEALRRTYNARGMDTSGNALLAAARASQERGSQDYNAYLDRLRGQAGMGSQMAQFGAGMTANAGNALAGMRYGHGQQVAGNEISYGNALAGTRNQAWQNLIGLGGAAAQLYGAGARK